LNEDAGRKEDAGSWRIEDLGGWGRRLSVVSMRSSKSKESRTEKEAKKA